MVLEWCDKNLYIYYIFNTINTINTIIFYLIK